MVTEVLKIYVTVVEQSSFSRAAEMLNLSQPGVSLHIRNLENEFGIKLIHRSPKYVKMTEAGAILYRQAKQMISLYEAAKEQMDLLRNEVTGLLRVGASYTIGEYILPHLLAELTLQYPQIEFSVTIANTEEITQIIRSGELDIGLVEGNIDDGGIQVLPPFMKDEIVLVASPNYSCAQKGSSTSILQDHVWVLREKGSGTREFSDQFIADTGIRVKRTYVFNSSQGVKEAVLAGLGLAMLSRWVVRRELESGELRSISLRDAKLTREFTMIMDKSAASDTMALRIFIEKLRQFQM